MSILKPVEETVDLSNKEIKDLIAYDIGITPDSINLSVKVDQTSGLSLFNTSPIEKATVLIATVILPGKTQKFEIYEDDLKQLLEKCLQQNFENNVLTFNYQKNLHDSEYELLSVSVGKKMENSDVLMNSLHSMQSLIEHIEIKPQSLEQMNKTIDSLEESIQKARENIKKNKF